MAGALAVLADTAHLAAVLPAEITWDPQPRLPGWGGMSGQNPDGDPIGRFLNLAQGVVVVIGVFGILYSAGKMVAGRLGRSEAAAEGVSGVIWTIMGISLMLVAIPIVTTLVGV
ncbi:hypothetical protein PWG71_17330 [Nocardiopsis sp. N85]|uniref:hypothetical protein n=1 Tax=Nocardiopsis sp. N85 TaxID=3029400 RepID=UPI00237F0658|nr:hypothetical protein [Nocardiopsis sp. N85]MDE3723157.1 hypothetical protein [Nocardiopsis sp. N85]